MNSTSEFLVHKKRGPRHQNHYPKWFTSKIMIKNVFLQKGCQGKTYVYVSRKYHLFWRHFHILVNALTQATLC